MPKQTFFNLPKEKRGQVLDAAVEEFSLRRFGEASINQIVRRAGIPRGSFYQYFEDKEDVYLYMLSRINEELAEESRRTPPPPGADALTLFLSRMAVTAALNAKKPAYNRIALLLEHDDSPVAARLKQASEADLARVAALFEADMRRGKVREDLDVPLFMDMVYALATKEFFRAGGDAACFERRMKAMVGILQYGIIRRD
jgi:AcrR family transcriptional regulator